jgi:hypothetical protein
MSLAFVGRGVVLVALAGLSAGPGSAAQSARRSLREAKSLACEFPMVATGTWSPAGVTAAQAKTATLTMAFGNIDAQEGVAELTSAPGSPEVVVQSSGGALHFIQVSSAGALYTTTVFAGAARPGAVKAVHSRHEYTEVSMPGYTSRPEQYYGDCTPAY